jgi:hypothetical protein
MYDALKSRYTFPCPARGETSVCLSAFRRVERLPGSAHPAIFSITFACGCGGEHVGLVSHEELDWKPLGLEGGVFLNLMTAHVDPVADEFADLSSRHIQAGDWPWSFFCYPEERPRPVYPSSFFLIAPGSELLGMAVRCPVCSGVSVNLVTSAHLDLPFHNDREVGVVPHVWSEDVPRTIAEFQAELSSARFDSRRLAL